MKKTLFFGTVFLVVLLFVTNASKLDCPESDDGEALFLEDPNDCNGYYECSNGEAIHLYCPPGTYYDGERKCQWPDNVICGDRPTTPVPTEPVTETTIIS